MLVYGLNFEAGAREKFSSCLLVKNARSHMKTKFGQFGAKSGCDVTRARSMSSDLI